jgi:hypothetical protein
MISLRSSFRQEHSTRRAQRLKCGCFSPGGKQHVQRVFSTHSQAATTDTGDHLKSRLSGKLSCRAQFRQMLDTRDFIPGCAAIFGEFRLDNHLRIELARDNEVRCLI